MKSRQFTPFMESVIVTLQESGKLGTAHIYRSTLRALNLYCGGRPLPFSGLTASWLKGFEGYYPTQLSGGMARRCALARAFHFGGEFFLMDEPFQGLDEESRKKAAQCILEHQEGRALLVISHEPKDAELLKARSITLESLMT